MAGEIDNVLFDLDGTLADTAPDLAGSLNRLLLEQNRPPLPFENIRPYVSHGGLAMICMAFGIDREYPELPELRNRFLEIYSGCLADQTRLFEGMDEVLARLEVAGMSWGVVTNKPGWLTLPVLRALELDERAGCIVSGDTLEFSKPHPAPMLHACRMQERNPSTTLYVGDSRRDIEAGHGAGMFTLVARYGYLGAEDEPANWGASGMVDAPLEILQWLGLNRHPSAIRG